MYGKWFVFLLTSFPSPLSTFPFFLFSCFLPFVFSVLPSFIPCMLHCFLFLPCFPSCLVILSFPRCVLCHILPCALHHFLPPSPFIFFCLPFCPSLCYLTLLFFLPSPSVLVYCPIFFIVSVLLSLSLSYVTSEVLILLKLHRVNVIVC